MAPTRSKKRKSTESAASVDVQTFPAPPQMVPTKTRSPTKTPNRSPIKKVRMGITVGQKQALIDNLQLEITERARKLRAQYMLQAQGLRSRIEIRVNRIPRALRTASMGELFMKYSEKTTSAGPSRTEKTKSPAKNLIQEKQHYSRASPSPQRAPKRMSDEMDLDKENEDLSNPKKRPRGPPEPPARTTSRANLQPSQVLSPRSTNSNSRSMPRSPIRPTPTSPAKSFLARPVSPLKPTAPVPSGGAAGILTNMVEKAKSTRSAATTRKATQETTTTTGVGRGKRAPAPEVKPRVGRGRAISDSSDGSTTTIVRKPVASAAPVKKAPVKKTVMGAIKGMGSQKKMPAAAKPAPAAATGAGGRVLRKRN